MALSNKHFKTPIIQIGRVNMYEPRAFKPQGDEKDKQPSKPSYSMELVFDPEDGGVVPLLKTLAACQQHAIDEGIDRGEWDEDMTANLAYKNPDKTKVNESATSKKKVILSDKRPMLKGKRLLTMKHNGVSRPNIKYLTAEGTFADMPEPILNPNPDDEREMEEAQRIRDFWDKMLYPGQNVRVSGTFSYWTMPTPAQGTKCTVDNIWIIGGGKRLGQVPFESDFTEEDALDALAWLRKANPRFKPADAWVEDALDESESPRPHDGDVEEEPAPKPRRKTRRRKPVEDEYYDGDDVVDDDVEEEPAPKPRRKPRRKPVEDEYAEDFVADDEEPVF